MSRRHSDTDADLQDLYDRIPGIPDCQGKCWISCGPVGLNQRERQRIRRAGYKISDWKEAQSRTRAHWCEALTSEGLCAVYAIRPLQCRLWGTIRGYRCPYGCTPERWLEPREALELLARADEIAGGTAPPGMADKIAQMNPAMAAALLAQAVPSAPEGKIRARQYDRLPVDVTTRKPPPKDRGHG